ncbi:HypC/HybG/HupF family hydrogenase formation chaperone [Streptosporangium sp. NPDC048047]|uniref:HypC/HybG/HupF family hydrogenase formation chaperone n=1 Tax=Streptosporangium sp. NPDC048047 TaxID=3155748 RepID=UPI00343A42FC
MSDEDGCCDTGPCVTCADEAVPMRVISIRYGGLAVAGAGPVTTEVSVALVDAAEGDTVLVHAGEAIAVVGRHRRAPEEAAPGGAVPGETVPGGAVPGETVPGDTATGETAIRDAAVQGAAIGRHRETW